WEYRYHRAVAYCGAGNDEAMRKDLAELESCQDLDALTRVEVSLLKAFLDARAERYEDAERILQRIEENELAKVPETVRDEVQAKINAARADYLCRSGNMQKIQMLMPNLNEEVKGRIAYLQAIAGIKNEQVADAFKSLAPFAGRNAEYRRLFSGVAAQYAAALIREDRLDRVEAVLAQVQPPPPALYQVQLAIQQCMVLQDIDSLAACQEAVNQLEHLYFEIQDEFLKTRVLHNIAVCRLRLAMLAEETRDKENVEEYWQAYQRVWDTSIRENLDYWNWALRRVSNDFDNTALKFAQKEIEQLVNRFREEVLLPLFLKYVVHYLENGSSTDLQRHLRYFHELAKTLDKEIELMQKLGITIKQLVDERSKKEKEKQTWDFLINYFQIQLAVRRVVSPRNTEALEKQLQAYIEYRNHYPMPSDFLNARKTFISKLLDTLQQGIEGKFSRSGENLEKILVEIPLGVNLDKQLENDLWRLREWARKPSKSADKGINLAQEFERMYQRVLNFSLQRQ
ncbi:MAG: hypothetical protein D6820_17410, partial [Lentisphaerae bacterium]